MYKRKITYKKTKRTTPLVELQPQRLKFTEESSMSNNDDNRHLKNFVAPRVTDIHLGYNVFVAAANNFELKPTLLYILFQHIFHGLAMFEELYNTIKINGVEHETIKLKIFSFSLSDKTMSWLRSLNSGTIII
jgi:hypothetical protein